MDSPHSGSEVGSDSDAMSSLPAGLEVTVDLKTAITLKPEARTKWLSKVGWMYWSMGSWLYGLRGL